MVFHAQLRVGEFILGVAEHVYTPVGVIGELYCTVRSRVLRSVRSESWFALVSATCVPFSDDTMTSQKGHVLLLVLVSATFCGAVHGFLCKSVLFID